MIVRFHLYRRWVKEEASYISEGQLIPSISRMFHRGADGREMGAKRKRLIDQGPSFYGTPPRSSFMYNSPPPYGYVSQPASQPPPFPVVRLRGLLYDYTEVDAAEFFHDLDTVDVLFVHKNNKFTGEAFCVLGGISSSSLGRTWEGRKEMKFQICSWWFASQPQEYPKG